MVKFVTAEEAVELVQDNQTIAIGGFGAYGAPEALLKALGERFEATGSPRNLTSLTGISNGAFDFADVGMNQISKEGLLGTILAAHLGNAPKFSEMVAENKVAAYTLPLGVVINLYQAIASKKPGVLTTVGLQTFVDPRMEGCKVNKKAIEQNREVVRLMKIDGEEYLFYPAFPINICFLRGTYADENGNISMERDALTASELEIAVATHNSGGIVIVQVEKVVKAGTIPSKKVRIHNSIVDYVTVVDRALSTECYATTEYRPELNGEIWCPVESVPQLKYNIRKVIARRAAMELENQKTINLGIGMPSGVGSVANEEGIQCLLSVESGPIGGVPLEGLSFGAALNPECIPSITNTLDLYDGGFLDMTFLGAGQVDEKGNVNVSKFGTKCTGPGGFIDISQNTKRIYFLSSFSVGKQDVELTESGLHICQDGKPGKFVKQVSQITFSAEYARKTKQEVFYITERAVFKLVKDGIMLIEIAPGVDLEKDILNMMDFKPLISKELKMMDMRLFKKGVMGIMK